MSRPRLPAVQTNQSESNMVRNSASRKRAQQHKRLLEPVVKPEDVVRPGGGEALEVKTVLMGFLGLGYWLNGFRCFAWMGVSFFLKDGLAVAPATMQILMNSANLPMVGKPLYGIVSDAVYIGKGHRLPYIAIGALLQALSWLSIVFLPQSYFSITILTIFLLLGNFGASLVEVANDAIVAESGKQFQPAGQLQSIVWIFASSAGALGNLLGGVAVRHLPPTTMFFLFSLLLASQFLLTISLPEKTLNLPVKENKESKSASIVKQLGELRSALNIPEISSSIAWFAASYAIVPILLGTMFYYQTEHLHVDSSVIGLSKVVGQGAVLAWSTAYNKWFKGVEPRKLLSVLQGTMVAFMLLDVLFVKGTLREFGLSDSAYIVVFSGLIEALFLSKVLPFSVLMAKLCPAGCEGSLMAFVMSVTALSCIISGYLGVMLASHFGVSVENFSGLEIAIPVQAACAALPLLWTWMIAGERKAKVV